MIDLRRAVFIFILTLVAFSTFERKVLAKNAALPLQESEAYQRYVRGPRSDLAKLLCLIGQFWNSDFKVIYNGNPYDANMAIQCARLYLLKNYKGEPAVPWIKQHVSKSYEGETIYLKLPAGERRPVADVLLEQLAFLNQIDQGQNIANPNPINPLS